MAIMLGGKVYRYDDDELWVNGGLLKEAYVNGGLVYPEHMKCEAKFSAEKTISTFDKRSLSETGHARQLVFSKAVLPVSMKVVCSVGSQESFTVNSDNQVMPSKRQSYYQDFTVKCDISFSAPAGLSVPASLQTVAPDIVIESGEAITTTSAYASFRAKFKMRALSYYGHYFMPVSIEPEPIGTDSWAFAFDLSGNQRSYIGSNDGVIRLSFPTGYMAYMTPHSISASFLPDWYMSFDKYSGPCTFDRNTSYYNYLDTDWGNGGNVDDIYIGQSFRRSDFTLVKWRH